MVESNKNEVFHDRFANIASHAVEIKLSDESNFLKIVEVLTRIGVPSYRTHSLYQTAHILHKRGHYYIVHFKDMFTLDGKQSDINEDDIDRVHAIAKLLQKWGLCSIIDDYKETGSSQILVIPRNKLAEWKLVPKYNIGKPRRKN